jgi:hypothetical protein
VEEIAVTITPAQGVLIMMNNYLHDVATALLVASAFTLWILLKLTHGHEDAGAISFFLAAQRKLVFLARLSLVWIIVGGIPRTIFYRDFEWADAAGKGQVPALVVKHILMFALVLLGAFGWIRMKRRVRELEARQSGTM